MKFATNDFITSYHFLRSDYRWSYFCALDVILSTEKVRNEMLMPVFLILSLDAAL